MVFTGAMTDEFPEGYDFYLYLTWVFFKEYAQDDLTDLIFRNEPEITNRFEKKIFDKKSRNYSIYTKVIVNGKNIELEDLGDNF